VKKIKKLKAILDQPIFRNGLTMVFTPRLIIEFENGEEEETSLPEMQYGLDCYPEAEEVRREFLRSLKDTKRQIISWNKYDTITGEKNAVIEEVE